MSRLNDPYFTSAASQVARGAANPDVRGWQESNGGIVMPRRVHLQEGQNYFRFASSTSPPEKQKRGCWWIEYQVLIKIARFARDHSDPRHAVRYFLALPWSWSAVDKLVYGVLEEPLDAFRGRGRPVRAGSSDRHRDTGTVYVPPQHIRDLYQLYVPGMQELGSQAFPTLRTEDIWSSKYFG